MASVQITYFYTISKIPVMAAILLGYLSPILVALFSILFWGERCAPSTVVALVLALSGCFLVVGGYNLELLRLNRLGILGGLAAAASFAAYALLGERMMRTLSAVDGGFLRDALCRSHVAGDSSSVQVRVCVVHDGSVGVDTLYRSGRDGGPFWIVLRGNKPHPIHQGHHHRDAGTHFRRADGRLFPGTASRVATDCRSSAGCVSNRGAPDSPGKGSAHTGTDPLPASREG